MPHVPLPPDWPALPDAQLLDVRMKDLPLRIEGSVLEARIAELRGELESRELRFPLHFYLADEWFTHDGVSAIAIAFYLAHPRLAQLEKAQMLEVEGGEHDWCMRILRHEAGHAIDNAYALRRRRRRRELFGSPGQPYPEAYAPKPYSKSYVLHLDSWYAQSHPDEDFAETFAVWLTPNSDPPSLATKAEELRRGHAVAPRESTGAEAGWKQRYAGWPALKKLEYMDALMQSLRGRPPVVSATDEIDPISRQRKTLRQHYRRKRKRYGIEHPAFYDRDLRRLFTDAPEATANMPATQFLARLRRPVRRLVAGWTGIYQYTIDQVIEDMITRCRELKLRLALPEDQAREQFTVLLTVQAMNYLHSGGHRVAL